MIWGAGTGRARGGPGRRVRLRVRLRRRLRLLWRRRGSGVRAGHGLHGLRRALELMGGDDDAAGRRPATGTTTSGSTTIARSVTTTTTSATVRVRGRRVRRAGHHFLSNRRKREQAPHDAGAARAAAGRGLQFATTPRPAVAALVGALAAAYGCATMRRRRGARSPVLRRQVQGGPRTDAPPSPSLVDVLNPGLFICFA